MATHARNRTYTIITQSEDWVISGSDGLNAWTLILRDGNTPFPHFLSNQGNRMMVERYGNDVAKFFISKFKKLAKQEKLSEEEKKKLRSLMEEFFRVKGLLAGEDEHLG